MLEILEPRYVGSASFSSMRANWSVVRGTARRACTRGVGERGARTTLPGGWAGWERRRPRTDVVKELKDEPAARDLGVAAHPTTNLDVHVHVLVLCLMTYAYACCVS